MRAFSGQLRDASLAKRWLVALLLAFAAGAANAQAEGPVWQGEALPGRYWVDEAGTATLDTVRAIMNAGGGQAADTNMIMPLGGGRAVWYRLQLPAVRQLARGVITVPHAGMDSVDLYFPDEAGRFAVMRAGDRLPVSQWAVRYLHPAFIFNMAPGPAPEAYLRIQHSQPVGVRWEFWDVRSFNEVNKQWHMFLGAYLGIAILVVLLSCANAFSWRDPIHLYYAGNVTLVALTQLSLTGLAGEYFWPDNAWWNDIAAVVLPALAIAASAWLVRQLVIERGMRLMPGVMLAYSCVGVLIAAGFLLAGRDPFFKPFNVYLLVGVVLLIGTLAWFTARRPQVGGWVLAGFLILLLAALLPVLRNFGVLPTSFATQYAPIIASAIDFPLVLTGLYFRSRERRDNRMRLAALTHTDPLTGVGSHRVLLERLAEMLRRQRPAAPRGAVLRVRVRNAAELQNNWGTEAGQAALVRAAECVAKEASEGDTVARHREGDFVLLLSGPLTREQLAAAGRNIIARGLKFSGRLPPGETLRLQVAAARSPFTESTAEGLLAALDEALSDPEIRPYRALPAAGEEAPISVARY